MAPIFGLGFIRTERKRARREGLWQAGQPVGTSRTTRKESAPISSTTEATTPQRREKTTAERYGDVGEIRLVVLRQLAARVGANKTMLGRALIYLALEGVMGEFEARMESEFFEDVVDMTLDRMNRNVQV